MDAKVDTLAQESPRPCEAKCLLITITITRQLPITVLKDVKKKKEEEEHPVVDGEKSTSASGRPSVITGSSPIKAVTVTTASVRQVISSERNLGTYKVLLGV